ncbi:MAG: beta-lactamase family protein [Undibacterium sp.]|nr:beta-lactamase family protein [Undibacterium sp.]
MIKHQSLTAPKSSITACIAWRLAFLACIGASISACSTLPGWMILQGKSSIGDFRHFDNAPITKSAIPQILPSEAVPLNFGKLIGENSTQTDTWLQAHDTVAFIVLRRGKVVYERYMNGYARDSITTAFSTAKSIVSALLGIAINEGSIRSVDDPLTVYLPELLKNDARFANITLRDLLQMRSGIAFNEGYGSPFAHAAKFYLTDDLPVEVAKLGIATAPGQSYSYKSGDTQLLGMALQRATGMTLAAYAQSRLWHPMGAEFDASWSMDSSKSGINRAFCCVNARAVDFARFGQLFLNGGQVAGKQIVPSAWVTQSTSALTLAGTDEASRHNIEGYGSFQTAFYAWQWRRAPQPNNDHMATPVPGQDFYTQGLYGQFIYVAPASDMVIVRFGRSTGGIFWPRWMGELARLNPPASQ